MKFTEIVNRLTGISCPVFGVSWNPLETDVAKARRAITYLEDRRVLYVPSEMESPSDCVQSVIEIRQFLTTELGSMDFNDALSTNLRAMRAACRKFLNTTQREGRDIIRFGAHQGHFDSWVFNGALGEMRGVFGIHIARIAAQYGLDVEDDLASILPERDEG